MKIGIIGLGLIGGSMAKAISEHTDHTVLGLDLDPCIVLKAKMTKVISQELSEDSLSCCDMLIVALYPKATVEYISQHAHQIKKGALVIPGGGEGPVDQIRRAPHGRHRAFGL